MKKIYLLFILVFSLLLISSCNKEEKGNVIATNYVGYDFANANLKDTDVTASMLLKPGEEVHGYSPSTNDIISIINCKLFIYVGGESDSEWVEKSILPKIDKNKTKVINMFDVLKDKKGNLYEEVDPNGEDAEEDEEEYDEHVWNDYNNALIIMDAIHEALISIFPNNNDKFNENYTNYKNEFNKTLNKINGLFETISYRPVMIVADRFPLLYLVNSYSIPYDAALSGCSTAKETSMNTLIRLKEAIESGNVPYIFTIELSTQKIATSLIKEVENDIKNNKYDGKAPEILTIYSMHNISKEDYEAGLTFVDYMNKNYDALKLFMNA